MRDIETSRLLLRAWRVNDAAEAASVFRYASDPLVGPRAGWPPHASVEESARIVRDVLAVENNWAIIVKFEGGRSGRQHRPQAVQLAAPGLL